MERLRSPSAAVDAPAETSGSSRSDATLEQLVDAVRPPAVMKADVDALLRGLARPPAAGVSPRARADFLLSLLNSRDIRSMKGSSGATVQSAAIRALMDLGHPYALEIPPDVLDADRPSRAARGPGKRSTPVLGIIVALLGSAHCLAAPPFSFVLAVPTLAAILGGWREKPTLQRVGLWLMGVLSLGWVGFALWLFYEEARTISGDYEGLDMIFGLLALIPGSMLGLGAFLLRHPAWRIEDKPPKQGETT